VARKKTQILYAELSGRGQPVVGSLQKPLHSPVLRAIAKKKKLYSQNCVFRICFSKALAHNFYYVFAFSSFFL